MIYLFWEEKRGLFSLLIFEPILHQFCVFRCHRSLCSLQDSFSNAPCRHTGVIRSTSVAFTVSIEFPSHSHTHTHTHTHTTQINCNHLLAHNESQVPNNLALVYSEFDFYRRSFAFHFSDSSHADRTRCSNLS